MITLIEIGLICTIISLVTNAITLTIFFLIRKRVANFFSNLGIYLILADIPLLLSSLVSISNFNTNDAGIMCNVLGPFREFSNLAVMFWNTLIIWTVYNTVRYNLLEEDLEDYRKKFLTLGYLIPIILALCPFIADNYKPYSLFCWIRVDEGNIVHYSVYLICYLIPLAVSLIISMQYYIRTVIYLRQFTIDEISGEFYALALYPIVLLICNSADVFDRAYLTFMNPEVILWVGYVHVILRQSQGFFNCLVFLLNPKVTYELCKVTKKFFKKKSQIATRRRIPELDISIPEEPNLSDSSAEHSPMRGRLSMQKPSDSRRFSQNFDLISKFFDMRTSLSGEDANKSPAEKLDIPLEHKNFFI